MPSPIPNSYYGAAAELHQRLKEPAPGRLQLLTGPRQVGKTTLMLALAKEWGERALYLALDSPEAEQPGWWELQWQRATERAARKATLLLLDEVQYLPDWSRRLKAEWDRVQRRRLPLHIVATGSAALRLDSGSRETMAGRFERLTLSHWPARDLAKAFNLAKQEAISLIVRLGGFPGTIPLRHDLPRWRAYVRDSILAPALGRDLLTLRTVRKPALLRQVFAICAGHPSEIVALHKLAGLLTEQGALATVAHYLELLQEAYLVAPVRKFSTRELRRRASPPKLVPLNNALISASRQEDPPTPSDPAAWGRLVENACLAFAINAGQEVHYWREEPLEVDAVLSGSWGKWALEIKTGPYQSRDLAALLEFHRRHPDHHPLVICDPQATEPARRLGVATISWGEFLWRGAEGVG